MIELFIAFIVGLILGYVIKNEKQTPMDDKLANKIQILEDDVAYYKKLTKSLVDENMEFRRKQ